MDAKKKTTACYAAAAILVVIAAITVDVLLQKMKFKKASSADMIFQVLITLSAGAGSFFLYRSREEAGEKKLVPAASLASLAFGTFCLLLVAAVVQQLIGTKVALGNAKSFVWRGNIGGALIVAGGVLGIFSLEAGEKEKKRLLLSGILPLAGSLAYDGFYWKYLWPVSLAAVACGLFLLACYVLYETDAVKRPSQASGDEKKRHAGRGGEKEMKRRGKDA